MYKLFNLTPCLGRDSLIRVETLRIQRVLIDHNIVHEYLHILKLGLQLRAYYFLSFEKNIICFGHIAHIGP